MAGELQAFRLRQVVSELRKLDREFEERQLQSHVLTRSVARNLDARDMVRLSTEFQIEARDFELRLSGLVGSAGATPRRLAGEHRRRLRQDGLRHRLEERSPSFGLFVVEIVTTACFLGCRDLRFQNGSDH